MIVQVIVRSGAKWGRPLMGRIDKNRVIEGILKEIDGTDAILMLSMIKNVYQTAATAARSNPLICIVHVILYHREADKSTPENNLYCATG